MDSALLGVVYYLCQARGTRQKVYESHPRDQVSPWLWFLPCAVIAYTDFSLDNWTLALLQNLGSSALSPLGLRTSEQTVYP